jgi:hypothetical protein
MQGKLNDAQARFMAAKKPEFELYDLKDDPHEINNLADDPTHAEVKATLLAEINRWRKEMKDVGVTEEFRKGGWTAAYPYKTLEEWQGVLKAWEQALLVEGKGTKRREKGGTKIPKKNK